MIELQSVWGWQPALYLFLGGMGAGAFVVAAVLYLRCLLYTSDAADD